MDDPIADQTAAIDPTNLVPPPLYRGAVDTFSDIMNGRLSAGVTGLLIKVVVPASVALLLMVVTYFAARLVSRWVASWVCHRVDQTLGKFVGKLTFYGIMILVGLTVLQTAKVDVTGFAAIIAAAGFAIGLAFQGTLSNFASGILLLVFRPFKVGDMINAAGVMGKVNEVDLFTTTLDTPDNRRLIVPNSSIAGTTIENITFHKHRRVDVPVGVAYAASLDQTRQVLTACAESLGDTMIRGDGRGYQILLINLGPHSVEWMVRVWAATADFFIVKEALTTEIKRQLDLHGLEIPFPQMQLHMKDGDHRSDSTHSNSPSLPIPKLSSLPVETVPSPRIRPRARGEKL
jgi:small conductance mechanosensitive channel